MSDGPHAADPVLRPTRWEDLARLAELERDLFGADAWSERTWWSELAARPRRAYVTLVEPYDDAAVLGYAGLDLGADVADVMTVALAPAARGRRLGHTLMRWLVDTASATDAAHLMLEVRADNTPALALYERWGFTTCSTRRGYYHGVDALVMRRPLGGDQTFSDPIPAKEQL